MGGGRQKGDRKAKTYSTPYNADAIAERREKIRHDEEKIDSAYGFDRISDGSERIGWLVSMMPITITDEETGLDHSALDVYFLEDDGSTFKVAKRYAPYFYISVKENCEHDLKDIETYLTRRFQGEILSVDVVEKEDLDLKNHVTGIKKEYLKLKFRTVQSLMNVRKSLLDVVSQNMAKSEAAEIYADMHQHDTNRNTAQTAHELERSIMGSIVNIREYDVKYHQRCAIDLELRVSLWYSVRASSSGVCHITPRPDLLVWAEARVLAFDIETTKAPLKFPVAEIDQIMMISYMIDEQGFLIVNRSIVSEDIEDFDYAPKPEYYGAFTVINEPNEEAVLQTFFEHIRDVRPLIYVTYNGDFFDWPFIEKRAAHYGMDMFLEIGVKKDQNDEYKSRFATHMDCLFWVKRDSYLPQGSQGLKMVTKAKLGYDPLELDPELMTPYAQQQPQTLASYSVSDAVATYFLYKKYIHGFIFSLCSIIPMTADEVLRKGSGTLCESLLMVEAYRKNIICPNRHQDPLYSFNKGHLIDSETYVGGKVECLESGVFRSDIPEKFRVVPEAFQMLIDNLDEQLKFAIEKEGGFEMSDITNYEEVKGQIQQQLEQLRDVPNRLEVPLIYHLDVGAMYPNIILTNRLQPSATSSCAGIGWRGGCSHTPHSHWH